MQASILLRSYSDEVPLDEESGKLSKAKDDVRGGSNSNINFL